jgi:hypothetical protein
MLSLKLDYRDLFRAPRLAFSLQRMWIVMAGVGLGWLIYAALTYLALLLAGGSLPDLWQRFGIYPSFYSVASAIPWYSWILYALGVVTLVLAFLLANTAHARAMYMSAKGEHFYSWRQSYAFAWRKLGVVIMTPVSLLLLILLFIAAEFVIGLLGRIPWAGELGMALFAPIWFFTGLLLMFFAIVLFYALILTPAIVATTDEDAFESIFQLFSLIWNQPWRILLYGLLSAFVALFSMGLFAFFCKQAVALTQILLSAFVGSNFADLANNGMALVQAWTTMGEETVFSLFRGFTPLIFFTQEFYYLPVQELARPTVAVAGVLYAVSLLFLAGWVLSYGFATLSSATVLSYLSLRKRKDGINLLERKDTEEECEEEAIELETGGEEPAVE